MGTEGTLSREERIAEFLRRDEAKDLLRFSTAGSVDDGKSTLIGRLLYDSRGVYEDQLAAVRKSSVNRAAGPIDFSLFTDGLRAEREQGITIDVAYRYFATARRKFIIADTPGHEQYTRNMATGASTADLAVILVDARNGVLVQSRRHAFISALLGIPQIVVAVNKMDLVDFREEVFEGVRAEFAAHLRRLGVARAAFIPISALEGDNVITRSPRTPWYRGESLLEHLENVPLQDRLADAAARFPVQYVIRPDDSFRGYAGQLASGALRPGDPVRVLPSGRLSRVRAIVTRDGDIDEAFAPMSVTVCLEDELDVSRGDMLVPPDRLPEVSRRFDATLVWMGAEALQPGRPLLLKQTTQQVTARVARLRRRVDVNTLAEEEAERLELNEIGQVTMETARPVFFDPYRDNRRTGSFILIDPISNATVAAGMIQDARREEARARGGAAVGTGFEEGRVTPAERFARAGHRPAVVWLAGPTEGCRELAYRLEARLFRRGCQACAVSGQMEKAVWPALAGALAGAGFVAILHAEGGGRPVADAVRAQVGEESFFDFAGGGDADVAAERICALLEGRGVIPPEGRESPAEA